MTQAVALVCETMRMTMKTYTGSCHCGAVRFEADLDLQAGTGKCNCSYCAKVRNWSITVKPEAVRILAGEDALSGYRFGTKSGEHLFCKHCGVRVLSRGYVEELGGAFMSVSLPALDSATVEERVAAPVHFADGLNNNWWNQPAETRHL